MTTVIEAHGLTKHFNSQAVVRGIDFTIPDRRCFGFLGPNGAGKTTTLQMILGLSPINSGTLRVFGMPVQRHGREIRARIGVMPQADNLDPELTVMENLWVYGAYFHIARPVLEQRIHKLLDFVGLADRPHDRPNILSGGLKRRLTFARALINDPELIILDEPTTGLDPQARHMIWARLRELKVQGRTLLLTTHYMEEAERLCDELVIMDHGRILDQDSPAALINRHVEPDIVEIHGDAQLVRQRLAGLNGSRIEAMDDTTYCYTRDASPVLQVLNSEASLSFSHRRSNLEDVFLQLTGHALRD